MVLKQKKSNLVFFSFELFVNIVISIFRVFVRNIETHCTFVRLFFLA